MYAKITLNPSGVRFNEREHTYHYEDLVLQGITGVLSRQLFPDKYINIPPDVLQRAADYGTSVHSTIELCDTLGDFNNTDANYQAYRAMLKTRGMTTLRNEYIVTDYEHYASGIDLVIQNADGTLCIADIKTTSRLDKDYVSWQLSIYRYLFEIVNPHLKGFITRLACVWLPRTQYGEPAFVDVEERSNGEIKAVFDADIAGHVLEPQSNAIESTENELQLSADAVNEVVAIETQYAEIKQKQAELRTRLLALMREHDIKSCDFGKLKLTRIVPASDITYVLDSAKVQNEYPEVFEACKKERKTSESLRVTVRDN